jgi:hypothetical protein
MSRSLRIAIVLVAGPGALTAAGSASALTYAGTVGPERTITLKRNGALVSRIPAGLHTFVIRDRSGVHNFVLKRIGGAEINRTGVDFVGERRWGVRVRRDVSYRYYCSTHARAMSRTFRGT